MRLAVLLGLALLLSCATPSFSQPAAGSFFVRGSVGLASQHLEDWNDDINALEQGLLSAGVPVRFEAFGGAMPLSLEVGYQAGSFVSVSLRITRQSDTADNSYDDFTGSLSTEGHVALTVLEAGVAYWSRASEGLFVGVDIGAGFGSATSELVFRNYSTPSANQDIAGDWSGNGVVGGIFGGYENQLPDGITVHGTFEYRFQNLGEFDGRVSSPQFGSQTGPPLNGAGLPMETDFSGFRLMLGVGKVF